MKKLLAVRAFHFVTADFFQHSCDFRRTRLYVVRWFRFQPAWFTCRLVVLIHVYCCSFAHVLLSTRLNRSSTDLIGERTISWKEPTSSQSQRHNDPTFASIGRIIFLYCCCSTSIVPPQVSDSRYARTGPNRLVVSEERMIQTGPGFRLPLHAPPTLSCRPSFPTSQHSMGTKLSTEQGNAGESPPESLMVRPGCAYPSFLSNNIILSILVRRITV